MKKNYLPYLIHSNFDYLAHSKTYLKNSINLHMKFPQKMNIKDISMRIKIFLKYIIGLNHFHLILG